MTKEKKDKKKKIKKQIKKQIKKIIRQKVRPSIDEQTKQNEMMKVILARNPIGQQMDPQYRDLIQKNQQIREQNNQLEAYKNNLRASIEQEQQRRKEIANDEAQLNQANKQLKRDEEYAKVKQKHEDQKEEYQFQKERMDGRNEIGRIEHETRNMEHDMKMMKRDIDKGNEEIKKNTAYQKNQLAKRELDDLKAELTVIDTIRNSPEFQQSDKEYVETQIQIGIAKRRLENGKALLKKEEELKELDAKKQIMEGVSKKYNEPTRERGRVDSMGRPIYVRVGHVVMTDRNGNRIQSMEPDPESSLYAQHVKQLIEMEKDIQARNSELSQLKDKANLENSMRKQISKVDEELRQKSIELMVLKNMNNEQQRNNVEGNLSQELQNKLKEQAKIALDTEMEKDRNKQLLEQQKENQKREYLRKRQEQMNSQEYQKQRNEIANAMYETNMMKYQNDITESSIKAKEIGQKHEAEERSLAMLQQSKMFDPQTMHIAMEQIANDEKARITQEMPRIRALSKHNELMDEMNRKYGNYATSIYNGVLKNSGAYDVNDDMPTSLINELNRIMQYTLDNLIVGFDEEVKDVYPAFIQRKEIREFFSDGQ